MQIHRKALPARLAFPFFPSCAIVSSETRSTRVAAATMSVGACKDGKLPKLKPSSKEDDSVCPFIRLSSKRAALIGGGGCLRMDMAETKDRRRGR